MGANTIFNLLNRAEILMVTEGLDIFSQKTPKSLVGEKLKDSKIREKTGCSIVAIVAVLPSPPSPDHQFSKKVRYSHWRRKLKKNSIKVLLVVGQIGRKIWVVFLFLISAQN